MDTNDGEYPEADPQTHNKVLRKVIVRRIFRGEQVKVNTGYFVNHNIQYYFPTALGLNHTFLRYVETEPYCVYVTAVYSMLVPGVAIGTTVHNTRIEAECVRRLGDVQWGYILFSDNFAGISCRWYFGDNMTHGNFYDWGPYAAITQVYPAMTYETEAEAQAGHLIHMCLGLYFGEITPIDADRGHRRFIRGPIPGLNSNDPNYKSLAHSRIHSLGAVAEILDWYVDQTEGLFPPVDAQEYYAIYVCAGARLVVIDAYNYPYAQGTGNHNRTLIQQGGLVVVEGPLVWSHPATLFDVFCRFNALTTTQAIDTGFLIAKDTQLEYNMRHPVVFLGPTESQYETHCWGLNIGPNASTGREGAILSAPENGVVLAIEEWDVGMREVAARHRYERLHQSVLTTDFQNEFDCSHTFAASQDNTILGKILGVDPYCYRYLEVNYNAPGIYTNAVPPNPPRRQRFPFVPIVCESHVVSAANLVPPPVRSLRHLCRFDSGNRWVLAFPPNQAIHERVWRKYGHDWYRQVTGIGYIRYGLSDGYAARDEKSMQKRLYYSADPINGVNSWVGADGWVYENDPNGKEIGVFRYPYFKWGGEQELFQLPPIVPGLGGAGGAVGGQ